MKYIVNYTISAVGLIEIEADSEDNAIDKVYAMRTSELKKYVNEVTYDVVEDSVSVSDEID